MIGIIGGCGNVGRWATYVLSQYYRLCIRVGGRNSEHFKTIEKSLIHNHDIKFKAIDVMDINSVQAFAKDCTIILNCSGPTYNYASKLAEVILSMGIGYVDVGYSKDMQNIYEKFGDKKIICKAGAIPGLSGVLPQYLAQKFTKVKQLDVYYRALGKFTQTAAADYLAGAISGSIGLPLFHRAIERKILPLSINESYIYQYYDSECEYVDRQIKCEASRWFMAVDGECTNKLLSMNKGISKSDIAKVAQELCVASYVDTLGRTEYASFIIQISGENADKHFINTLLMMAPSAEYVAGVVAASSVILLKNKGKLINGGELYKIKELTSFIDIMLKIGQNIQINILDKSIDELIANEEGEI